MPLPYIQSTRQLSTLQYHTRLIDTRLIDSVLQDVLRIVTGCFCPTPTDHLPIFSGIQPVELCRLGATLSLAYRGSLDPDYMLHGLTTGSSDARQERD